MLVLPGEPVKIFFLLYTLPFCGLSCNDKIKFYDNEE